MRTFAVFTYDAKGKATCVVAPDKGHENYGEARAAFKRLVSEDHDGDSQIAEVVKVPLSAGVRKKWDPTKTKEPPARKTKKP